MVLRDDGDKGTERDGSTCEEYCAFCYQRGAFVRELTMEELVESNLLFLEEWNRENGLHLTREEARAGLLNFCQRWRDGKMRRGRAFVSAGRAAGAKRERHELSLKSEQAGP